MDELNRMPEAGREVVEKTLTRLQSEAPALFNVETIDAARRLLENGADIQARNSRDRTPLHDAVNGNRIGVARYFLEQGADVNAPQDIGDTPLCSARSAEMAQMLLDHGAALETETEDGMTPLMRAAGSGYKDVVELLIRSGANVNVFVPCFGTPLIEALMHGHLDIAAILLEAGADVHAINNKDGFTPLHAAIYPAYCEAITDRMAGRETLTQADIVHRLMARGADLCARNTDGELPYQMARRFKAAELLAALEPYIALLPDPFPPLPGPPQSERICIHPARQEAVTTVRYGGLARWSLDAEPRLLTRVQTPHSNFEQIAVSPDGAQIAVVVGNTVELRRWDDLSLVASFTLSENEADSREDWKVITGTLAFAPNGRWLAAAPYSANIYLLDATTGESILEIEEAEGASWLAFDTTSRLLACGGECVSVYKIGAKAQNAKLLWNDYEAEAEFARSNGMEQDAGDEEDIDEEWDDMEGKGDEEDAANRYWKPLFLVHGAISPNSRRLAYFGADEYPPPDSMGELVMHDLQTGSVLWHTPLDQDAIGEDHLTWRDFFDKSNRVEVVFIGNTEVACGATKGAILCYEADKGQLNRRFYLDTEADVSSLAYDPIAATLWAVLSDGQMMPVRL